MEKYNEERYFTQTRSRECRILGTARSGMFGGGWCGVIGKNEAVRGVVCGELAVSQVNGLGVKFHLTRLLGHFDVCTCVRGSVG